MKVIYVKQLTTNRVRMLCALIFITTGAIWSSGGDVTLDGRTTFVGNAAADSGGET